MFVVEVEDEVEANVEAKDDEAEEVAVDPI
jgi:hypothetical protein